MNRYNLTNIHTLGDKKVFFDANILLYLFWSTHPYFEAQYSIVYTKLKEQKNKLAVHFVVISEVVNRAIKIAYETYLIENSLTRKDMSYKSFRDSADGIEAQEDIYTLVKAKIINDFEIVDTDIYQKEIESMLVIDSLDFSDKLIVTLCKNHEFVLLTNDSDFKNSDIDILTLNHRI